MVPAKPLLLVYFYVMFLSLIQHLFPEAHKPLYQNEWLPKPRVFKFPKHEINSNSGAQCFAVNGTCQAQPRLYATVTCGMHVKGPI